MFAIKFINVTISIILLHSCSIDSNSFYPKRSAKNSLVDSFGDRSEKRRPIENSNYIRKAKKNILSKDIDDDDDDEDETEEEYRKYDLNSHYKKMYEDMLYKDQKLKRSRLTKGAETKKIFDQYNGKTAPNSTKPNQTNKALSPNQDKLLQEIEALKKRIESLSAKDCSLNDYAVKELQDSPKERVQDNRTHKTPPSNIVVEEGASCLLPE